jgi:histone H3/H4
VFASHNLVSTLKFTEMDESKIWRKCSSCKNPILLSAKYYVCSVSTCTSARTDYVFCGMDCFERHLPGARHRDAGAISKIAPNSKSAGGEAPHGGTRRIVASAQPQVSSAQQKIPREVLIIASRLKEYIQARADYNTSGDVMDVLSDYVRVLCDRAIDNARNDGRKTVMARDLDFLKNQK